MLALCLDFQLQTSGLFNSLKVWQLLDDTSFSFSFQSPASRKLVRRIESLQFRSKVISEEFDYRSLFVWNSPVAT